MHRLATIHNVTDDRQTQHCIASAPPLVRSAKKRLKVRLCNFHRTEDQSPNFCGGKFHPGILTGPPDRGCQTRVGKGKHKLFVFSSSMHRYLKTVRDASEVTTNDQKLGSFNAYAL